MKFGPLQVAEAEGCILAHSVPLARGRLRKGLTLQAKDVEVLLAEGHQVLTFAQPDPDDMTEDAAAEALATALIGQAEGLRRSAAATGRVNIHATGAGIVVLDEAALHAFNAINPMITVATLPQFMRVEPGTMVATIKIISYAVPDADVAHAAALAHGAIVHRAPICRTATLIETVLSGAAPLKGREAMSARLARLGMTLTDRIVVSHDADSVAVAIANATGDAVFVLTASATSDAADVGPAGLDLAGGTLVQFGMPVDPGNLLFLGRLGKKPVIGLPGCARSPALNGADWVLERVLCGVELSPSDFAAMGVGGLLKEIPTRPKPRGDIED